MPDPAKPDASAATAAEVPHARHDPPASFEPPPSVRFGRFETVRVVGAGGMGVVYEARDPTLGRSVAVKTLGLQTSAAMRQRLLREARAMAQVGHPNVVPVYEIGEQGDEVFVAMELVEGTTLGAWAREPRSLREILARYLEAGRGLEAVHAAGLVHRDFKPDNVLIGSDGRARVTDFGLARGLDVGAEAGPPRAGFVDLQITAAHTAVGTPAYMAPEHFRGDKLGPAADQFSFCTALYRALYGAPPFAGDSFAELEVSVCEGRVVPPAASEVPVPIRDAVLRGLRPEPEQRWPSFAELLAILEAELARDPQEDLTSGARTRVIAVAILAAFSASQLIWMLAGHKYQLSQPYILVMSLIALAMLGIIGVTLRRRLLGTLIDRRIGALFLITVLTWLFHRLAALGSAISVPAILTGDAFSAGGLMLFGAVALDRWLIVVALVFFGSGGLLIALPQYHAPLYALTISTASVVAAAMWRVGRREASPLLRRAPGDPSTGRSSPPRGASTAETAAARPPSEPTPPTQAG